VRVAAGTAVAFEEVDVVGPREKVRGAKAGDARPDDRDLHRVTTREAVREWKRTGIASTLRKDAWSSMKDPGLANARVWLTGASTGIGAALVPQLVAAGARVALSARRRELLDAVAASQPRDVLVVPCDVTDREAVLAAGRAVISAFGGLDLAILNAGGHSRASVAAFSTEPFTQTYALNYFGVLHAIEAVLPTMQAQRAGHLAVISSASAYNPMATVAAYGSSKAAIAYTMDALRYELAPWGVDVSVVYPGFVRTPLTAKNGRMPFLMEPDEAARRILDGLVARRAEVHFPKRLTWLLKVVRGLPGPVRRALMGRAVPPRGVLPGSG
jgi:short-subunit dehydrogenase